MDGEKGTGKMGVGSDSLAQSRGEWKDFLGAMRRIDPLAMGHDQILWPVKTRHDQKGRHTSRSDQMCSVVPPSHGFSSASGHEKNAPS